MAGLPTNLTIEGEPLMDLVRAVTLEEGDAGADQATLLLDDPAGALLDVLQEGMAVTLDLGSERGHARVFSGVLTHLSGRYAGTGSGVVEVQALDSLILLSGPPRTRRFSDAALSDIVRQIAREGGLRAGRIEVHGDPIYSALRPCLQLEETDLAFLGRLAREHDCRLYAEHEDGDTLHFLSAELLLEADPIEVKLVLGANLAEFQVSFDAFAVAARRRLVTTDVDTGERIERSRERPLAEAWTPDIGRMARLGADAARMGALFTKGESRRAQATAAWSAAPRELGPGAGKLSDRGGVRGDAARWRGQSGRGQAAGDVLLRPRRRVLVEGCGGRWSGAWYLAQVTHEMDRARRSYTCSVVCTR